MARTKVSKSDKGKRVVNNRGETVGMVTEIKGGAAHVDPDPSITERIRSRLGWDSDTDDDEYVLQNARIDEITDDEIRLKD